MTSRSGKEGLNVRHRTRNLELGEDSSFISAEVVDGRRQRQSKAKINPLIVPFIYPAGILFILFQIVLYLDGRLPSAISITDTAIRKGSPFSSERAMGHLNLLSGIGPRVTGSDENEIVAVDFLLREINWATASITAREKDRVLISTQRATGWYYLAFKPHGMLNTYEGIQNIVVKIKSKTNSASSLLINCHFDSVPTSPGASDDGVNCAIMLELLRVLSEPGAPDLPHNVIFLFNGAEENPLQASHAFISQHEWAKEVQAFINLEAAGAGGKEILFQAGPGNSWLVKAYAESVPYPFGNVIGEEIFQSGLIPSDTDFRVFRDFGKIPGLDFAYARNGYVYHTKYDDTSRIPLGTIQHTGDNLLAFIPRLMSSPEFSLQNKNTSKLSPESIQDRCIYFDILGLHMVSYSEGVALGLNLLTVFLSVITIFGRRFGSFSSTATTMPPTDDYYYQLMLSYILVTLLFLFSIVGALWLFPISEGYESQENRGWKIVACGGKALAGWIIGAVIAISTAVVLDYLGRPMSWFTRPALIFPLFYCPTLGGCLLPYALFPSEPSGSNFPKYKSDDWERVYMDSLGVQLIWTVIILACTTMGIRSTYVFTFLVLFPALAHFIIALVYKLKFYPVKVWVIMRQAFSLAPLALEFYYTILALTLFVPITARMGSKLNPDLLIGVLSVILCLLAFSHIVPLIHLVHSPKKMALCLLAIHCLAVLAVLFTPIGFPFGSKPTEPTPQRATVLHVRSRQHLPDQTEHTQQKNVFWMVDLDRNGAHFSLPKAVERGCHPLSTKACEKEFLCGMPLYVSRMVDLLPHTHVVPAPEPVIHEPSSLKLVSQKALSSSVRRMTFSITGSDHMSLLISPAEKVTLQGWAYGEVPNATYYWQDDRPVYYIYHSIGIHSNEPWVVWIDLKVPLNRDYQYVVDVALTVHYNHGDPALRATKTVNEHLGPVAPWAHLISWTATYDGYKF